VAALFAFARDDQDVLQIRIRRQRRLDEVVGDLQIHHPLPLRSGDGPEDLPGEQYLEALAVPYLLGCEILQNQPGWCVTGFLARLAVERKGLDFPLDRHLEDLLDGVFRTRHHYLLLAFYAGLPLPLRVTFHARRLGHSQILTSGRLPAGEGEYSVAAERVKPRAFAAPLATYSKGASAAGHSPGTVRY